MLTLKSLTFLSAEQVARNLLLGESCILRMQSSCALMIFWLVFDICSPQQFSNPQLSPIAIRQSVSLIVIDRMLQSTSIFIISRPFDRSHHLTIPSSSPVTIEPQFGCKAVQLIGLSCLNDFTAARVLISKSLKYPSSHPVQIRFSCFQKQPTDVTFPLKSLSQDRRCWSGRFRSYTLAQLFIPMTILLLSSVISMRLGAEVSLMVSVGLLVPLEGSQNLIVLSQEPLASFRAMNKDNDDDELQVSGKHHFLVLNLLILGITTDQNFLPTLLPVEPVSAMVSTLPVKTFSLPILNSTQLSFLVSFSCCFRAGLELVSKGESQLGQEGFLLSSQTVSFSSSRSLSPSAKQGWLRASTAVMRSCGFFFSIFPRRFRAFGSIDLYSSPSSRILLALFCASTSLQVFPGNALTPSSKIWKMSPKLKISQMGSYLVFISLMLMTSGATQPGVPHLTNRYSCASANSASPKSAIAHSKLPSALKRMFSGFRSRCMIFLLCISLRPCRMVKMAVLTSIGLNLYFAFTLSQS